MTKEIAQDHETTTAQDHDNCVFEKREREV